MKTIKSNGLPINLHSLGEKGKSGKYGEICSENCPERMALDLRIASLLYSGKANSHSLCFLYAPIFCPIKNEIIIPIKRIVRKIIIIYRLISRCIAQRIGRAVFKPRAGICAVRIHIPI